MPPGDRQTSTAIAATKSGRELTAREQEKLAEAARSDRRGLWSVPVLLGTAGVTGVLMERGFYWTGAIAGLVLLLAGMLSLSAYDTHRRREAGLGGHDRSD